MRRANAAPWRAAWAPSAMTSGRIACSVSSSTISWYIDAAICSMPLIDDEHVVLGLVGRLDVLLRVAGDVVEDRLHDPVHVPGVGALVGLAAGLLGQPHGLRDGGLVVLDQPVEHGLGRRAERPAVGDHAVDLEDRLLDRRRRAQVDGVVDLERRQRRRRRGRTRPGPARPRRTRRRRRRARRASRSGRRRGTAGADPSRGSALGGRSSVGVWSVVIVSLRSTRSRAAAGPR